MTLGVTRVRAATIAIVFAPVLANAQGSGDAKASTPAALAKPSAATVSVIAGERYRAGVVQRWFLGDVYRDLWTTAMRVPLLDLETFAGGLKALKAGGGMQSKSLRLVARDGSEYVFRIVLKDHAWTVPPRFKGSLIEKMSRDQGSTGHPAGAMVAAPLLAAAGVLHATPILVVMPTDAPLGEFSEEFSGQLGIIEQYPHKPEKGEGFAGASQIIDSEELLKKLNEDPEQHVNARAFLTARVMDMFLGDWDRHPGQWKWARMEPGKHGAWVAIARDRDMAFVTYEGVVAKIGHVFTPVSARFSGTSANVAALTNNSLELDRRLLSGLDKLVWDSVAAAVTARLTDAVIDAAVAELPAEYAASAPRLASALKERRTRLGGTVNAFYALVFHVVDIHATDQAEKATITRVSDRFVDVLVESKGATTFARRFDARETKEIRLYLHGGDDSAVVVGAVRRSIPVRIIGGNGTNRLVDSSTVDGERHHAHLYDTGTVQDVNYGKDTLFNRQHWETQYGVLEPAARDRGHAMVPSGMLGVSRDLGFTTRVGLARYDYGFERRPYASMVALRAEYAQGVHGYRFTASADQRLESSPLHFTETARLSTLELVNYFGMGNATSDSGEDSRYFASRQRQLMFRPAIAIALGPRSDISLGPIVQYSSTDNSAPRFITANTPYGYGRFGQAGVLLNLHHEVQDRATDPERRFSVNLNGTYYPAVWDVRSAFEAASLGVVGAIALPVPTHPMLVFVAGGKKVFGDFPFNEAAFIGGNQTTTYMDAQRYAGDASVYGSTELRIPVTTVPVLVPIDVGIVGVAEAGRVYLRGESPGGWHSTAGGGLWFSLRGDHIDVLTLTMTSDRAHHVQLSFGLAF